MTKLLYPIDPDIKPGGLCAGYMLTEDPDDEDADGSMAVLVKKLDDQKHWVAVIDDDGGEAKFGPITEDAVFALLRSMAEMMGWTLTRSHP
jgi:hypothetical protein